MSKVVIIAEAGVNHNGQMDLAVQLIDAAARAGADYVKFQSFKANKLVSKKAKKAEYQQKNMGGDDDSQFAMLKQLELSHEDHLFLIQECSKRDIKFLSTAFDVDGLDYLADLGIDVIKLPSGEITNYPYLRKIGQLGLPTILSTGMSDLNDIKNAIEVITSAGLPKELITVLHCNTEYPTPMEDVNLKAMNTIGVEFNVPIGYSDHTLGIEVPIAAVAMGATVIEKHFTLDRSMSGPDHKASLEPAELVQMVTSIRNIEKAISGDGRKAPSNSEKRNISIARKSIHIDHPIEQGEVFSESHLIALRPGDGISPMRWNEIIGSIATRSLEEGHQLIESDFS